VHGHVEYRVQGPLRYQQWQVINVGPITGPHGRTVSILPSPLVPRLRALFALDPDVPRVAEQQHFLAKLDRIFGGNFEFFDFL